MKTSYFAGFDFGGTQLKFGVIDGKGHLQHKGKVPTPSTMESLLLCLEEIWGGIRKKTPGAIRACGLGFAGFYSTEDRKILHSPNYPDLDDFDLVPAIEKFLDVPFWINNDANLAAFGEFMYGAGQGSQSLVLLTVGTGIGSGIILDGLLWQGKCGFAGEIGHITVNPDGERCNCGSRGCLETEAAAPKIIKTFHALTRRKDDVTTKEIYNLARGGDKAAVESFARSGYYLGIGLGIVITLLNPEIILIGGGVTAAGRYLLRPAIDEARRRSHRVSFSCCRIRRATLGNDAGLIGAAAWAQASLSRRK